MYGQKVFGRSGGGGGACVVAGEEGSSKSKQARVKGGLVGAVVLFGVCRTHSRCLMQVRFGLSASMRSEAVWWCKSEEWRR